MTPVVVTWDGGMRFTAAVRGHLVHVDQPLVAGGEDTAPTPLELVPASLGSCVAFFVQQFLAVRGLDAHGLAVTVSTSDAADPHRIGRFDVTVHVPAGVPARYEGAVRRAAETCTVHHTLTHQPVISVVVEGAVGVGAA